MSQLWFNWLYLVLSLCFILTLYFISILRYISPKLLYRSLSLLLLIKYLSTKQVSGGREDKLCREVKYLLKILITFYELLFCEVFIEVYAKYFLETFIIFCLAGQTLLQFFHTWSDFLERNLCRIFRALSHIVLPAAMKLRTYILILNRTERNIWYYWEKGFC